MTFQFACVSCGSPSIVPPSEFTDAAVVLCKGCGRTVTTWGELRRRTRQAMQAEALTPMGAGATMVSPDPLGLACLPSAAATR